MNLVDIAIIGVVSLSIVTGLFRGFVKELISLCIWILAFWMAYNYAAVAARIMPSAIHLENIRNALGFILILIATLILGGIFNALLGFIVTRTGLSSTDRILGMGFGLVRGIFIVAVLILGVQMLSLPTNQYDSQSVLYAKFIPIVDFLKGYMPDFLKQVGYFEHNITSTQIVKNNLEINLE